MLLKWLSDRLAKRRALSGGRPKGTTEADLDHMTNRGRRLELARAAHRMGLLTKNVSSDDKTLEDSQLFEWSERR